MVAMASLLDDYLYYECKYLGNGLYETVELDGPERTVTTGPRDDKGRWNGPVKVVRDNDKSGTKFTEEVNMIHGMRNGISSTTMDYGYRKSVYHELYVMGHVPGSEFGFKALNRENDNISSLQVLYSNYPWFFHGLNSFGFDSLYVKGYMNTVELKLGSTNFELEAFDDVYGDIIDELQDTPYDSIITLNSMLTMAQARENLKNDEFRLAVIDHYRLSGSNTYNVINETYPGYLLSLNNSGINNQDFKDFCKDLDTRMTGYGQLNPNDPFFIDSIDARIFRALSSIMDTKKSTELGKRLNGEDKLMPSKKGNFKEIFSFGRPLLRGLNITSTPAEVAQAVINSMMQQYVESEILRQAFREAWIHKKGIIMIPSVATVFGSFSTASSASMQGYVLESGGANVTSRGVAWSKLYNPTTKENVAAAGSGTGKFNITLTGLTPGTTYYARAYASNSKGTAYGNCISFNSNIVTGITDYKRSMMDFTVYPNPASGMTTFGFQVKSEGSMILSIIDINGHVALQKKLDNLNAGDNTISLDLSLLSNGIYTCRLTNGTIKTSRKLIIAH
jgi:hypothetical protein